MSQSLLNRTPSYSSCYSTAMPIKHYGSIENLLHGHSKSNPANIHVLIRKNFQSFAQAHLAVTKGKIFHLDYCLELCRDVFYEMIFEWIRSRFYR
jgi:hypothetical protein